MLASDNGTLEVRQTYFCSLLERFLAHCYEDDSVWSKTVRCGRLDVFDDILTGGKVDKGRATELLEAHLLLLLATVDGDSVQPHGLGVLLC